MCIRDRHIHYTVMSNSYNLRSAPPSVTELTERFDRNAGGATEPYVSTELVGVGTPMMDVGGDGPGSGQLSSVDDIAPRVALSTPISITQKSRNQLSAWTSTCGHAHVRRPSCRTFHYSALRRMHCPYKCIRPILSFLIPKLIVRLRRSS